MSSQWSFRQIIQILELCNKNSKFYFLFIIPPWILRSKIQYKFDPYKFSFNPSFTAYGPVRFYLVIITSYLKIMKNPFILYNSLLYTNTCYLHHPCNLFYLLYWFIYLKWHVWRQIRWLYGSAFTATWTTQCTSNTIALTLTHCFSASLNVRSLGKTTFCRIVQSWWRRCCRRISCEFTWRWFLRVGRELEGVVFSSTSPPNCELLQTTVFTDSSITGWIWSCVFRLTWIMASIFWLERSKSPTQLWLQDTAKSEDFGFY